MSKYITFKIENDEGLVMSVKYKKEDVKGVIFSTPENGWVVCVCTTSEDIKINYDNKENAVEMFKIITEQMNEGEE